MKEGKSAGKGKPGRPAFEPTAEQRAMVKSLAGLGTPHEGIRLLVKDGDRPISLPTLTKHFEEELESGRVEANAKVAKSLFNQATAGENVTAMIFWLKTRAGWKETPQTLEHTGPDGKPLAVPTLSDFYKTVAIFDGKDSPTQDEAS